MTPYYDDGVVTLYHGDCREVLPEVVSSDCAIITDPPYGIAHPTDYARRGRDGVARCRDYPPVVGDGEPFDPAPILALAVPTLLWGANYYADRLPVSSGWLVWDKRRPHDLNQATVELAWTNYVKGARIFHHLWNGAFRESERDPLTHPTQKPVALMQWCLGLRWTPTGTVVDPYCGTGATLVAAKSLGRRARRPVSGRTGRAGLGPALRRHPAGLVREGPVSSFNPLRRDARLRRRRIERQVTRARAFVANPSNAVAHPRVFARAQAFLLEVDRDKERHPE